MWARKTSRALFLAAPTPNPVIPNTGKARVRNLLFSATSEQQVPALRRRYAPVGMTTERKSSSFVPVANPVPACAKA